MRMSAAVIACTLVLASLTLVSAARADEPLAGIATPVAVLHWVNGDRLPGTVLDSDLEGRLQWQGTAFTKPFRFDGESISKIRFAAPSFAAAEAGEFRFDLTGGDVLFGDLTHTPIAPQGMRCGRSKLVWKPQPGAAGR